MAKQYKWYAILRTTLHDVGLAIKEKEGGDTPDLLIGDAPARIRALPASGIHRGIEVNAVDENGNWTDVTIYRDVPNNILEGQTSLVKARITRWATVGDNACSGCTGLVELILDEGTAAIGNSAFYNTAIQALVIPESVTSIGNSAFYGTDIAGELVIPRYVTFIGTRAFQGNTGTTKLVWLPTAYPNDMDASYPAFAGCTGVKEVQFGEDVTRIPGRLCNGFTGLEGTLTIPATVIYVGPLSFNGCAGITKLVWLPTAVSKIGDASFPVFNKCTGIKEVEWGDGITHIPSCFLYGATGLEGTLTIPATVIYVGTRAFQGNTGITKLVWLPTAYPGSLERSYHPFKDCSGIKYVECGENVTSVPNSLCYGMSGLESFVIRNTSAVVTLGGTYAFTSTPIASGTGYIYVPDALVDSYKAATNWATYADQIKPLSEYVEG